MSIRQAITKDVGGTVSYLVPEGTPTAGATCAVYFQSTSAEATPTVTITSATLSAPITAGVAATVGMYRVRWSYTVSGTAYLVDNLFDVVLAAMNPPCSPAVLVERFPILTQRYPRGVSSHQRPLTDAWEEIVSVVRASDFDPNKMIDSRPFEACQAYLAAARVADNLSVGSAATGDEWASKAANWRALGEDELARVLAKPWWYDSGNDLLPSSGETRAYKRVISMR